MSLSIQTQPPPQTPISCVATVDDSSPTEKPKIKLRFRLAPRTSPSATESSVKEQSPPTCDEKKETPPISEAAEPSSANDEPSSANDEAGKAALRSDQAVEKKGTEKPSKSFMFSIELTKEEIEADILEITGGKRMKRKWTKKDREAQKAKKNLFPGYSISMKNQDYFRRRYGLNGK